MTLNSQYCSPPTFTATSSATHSSPPVQHRELCRYLTGLLGVFLYPAVNRGLSSRKVEVVPHVPCYLAIRQTVKVHIDCRRYLSRGGMATRIG